MSTDYNASRGIALLENKIRQELKRKGADDETVQAAVEAALNRFGDCVGVMPIGGLNSASRVAESCNQALRGVSNPDEAREAINGVTMGAQSTGEIRRVVGGFSELGREDEVTLDYQAADLGAEIDANASSESEITIKVSEGGRVKEIIADVVDMLPYVDGDDLSDEGKRSLGFLPPDFDSMSTLGQDTPEIDVEVRKVGRYGYDSDGELFIECPECSGRDVCPMGSGTYMCLSCPQSTQFDVDLLINDLLPEDR